MPPTGQHARVLQLHPTRACNLRCLHCYSSSGPEQRSTLDLALLQGAIDDAREEGYNVLSVSGGEPLLYARLSELLDHARDRGLFTTVTTNGMLLDRRRLEALAGRTDLLAVSLDGKPESHDRLRANARAFSAMQARLPLLRASGLKFGFVFTLTRSNADELPWAAAFACAQGAALFQIHPLEETGRATVTLGGQRPDAQLSTIAWVLGRTLERQYAGRMAVQVDLVDLEALASAPCEVYADDTPGDRTEVPLADLVSPLVVETDGTVSPLQYGFARTYALGNLHQDRLAALATRWRRDRGPSFRRLCRRSLCDLGTVTADLPIVNWFEEVARRAEISGT
jgi:MoaA/NifB/PqqE/SkfB family radical SAM enzyme